MTALINSLFFPSSPATIFWRVWAIVIDAVEGHIGRRVSHVRKESFKTALPTFTNRDPASAVIGKRTVVGVRAAVVQISPAAVNACPCTFGSLSVLAAAGQGDFKAATPATRSVSLSEFGKTNDTFNAAIATAKPVGISVFHVREPNSDQAAKALVRDVSESRHVKQCSRLSIPWKSPNPWTVIATLTKALQEAMARIEALEEKLP